MLARDIVKNANDVWVEQFLRKISPLRQRRVFKKIKAYLREKGLSKEDVKKGIIQIMTKPRVPLAKIEMYISVLLSRLIVFVIELQLFSEYVEYLISHGH
ncbi:hypothetical protein TSAR_004290 [Trichomalopsis sarcophagae]|uniref:Uncharacterized protein n=1 Tax=Trichomalopsis sarcophagae TaxID=543379 RepID=A0A232F1W3_9HYME|nr:hypothetical protein TSAR_004290 [Trichomalopsis sarcophagae]